MLHRVSFVVLHHMISSAQCIKFSHQNLQFLHQNFTFLRIPSYDIKCPLHKRPILTSLSTNATRCILTKMIRLQIAFFSAHKTQVNKITFLHKNLQISHQNFAFFAFKHQANFSKWQNLSPTSISYYMWILQLFRKLTNRNISIYVFQPPVNFIKPPIG